MPRPRHRRHRVRHPLLVGAVVLALAAGAAAAGLLVDRHAQAASDHGGGSSASTPLRVLSTDPVAEAATVAPDSVLTVAFDEPLAPGSPVPTLVPPVPGTWAPEGPTTLAFELQASLPPGAEETIEVPGGSSGIRAADGAHLAQGLSIPFTVAPMSTLRTQQLLGQLGYLPLLFAPAGRVPPAAEATDQAGAFTWRWTSMPASFTALWSPGQANVVTQGAVMAFESQHGLATDGEAGPQVWSALLAALAAGQGDSDPHYDWVDVSTTVPESVTVWRDGAAAYATAANTGVEGAATQVGTWPVYARYTSTTMSGTNLDGSHYDDPGVPWVSYFHGGDALHGFIRASYGTPQSLGCVEMPPANAAVVYPMTPLGTLVTIE